MKSYFPALLIAMTLSLPTWAHNQSPTVVRRTMAKAFESLGTPVPGNVFKGDRTVRAGGATAQVFSAAKDGSSKGSVAQIEVQEVVYAVAIDSGGRVTAVAREGRIVEESEWKALSFVEEIRKSVSPGAKP